MSGQNPPKTKPLGQNPPGQNPPWTKSSEFGQTSITYINIKLFKFALWIKKLAIGNELKNKFQNFNLKMGIIFF